ncbi:hypothetical protein ACG5V6_06870 [Streptomyces chitinivorans]|uniref:Uncharacterized protein n=1 Tax=Streptomyces chitinivorans TaxID=1257027 RepID=A0ABW7HQ92_9ACTN|nr:hypothetical protein [Streptomyces chitinivorans]MDH2410133.1 hypothetical protein [Streptomyces chitinivorans]
MGTDSSGGMDKGATVDANAESGRSDQALEARVRSLLADSESGKQKQESQGSLRETDPGSPDFSLKASPGSPGTSTTTMPLCVREGVDRDVAPLAVGMSEYEGRQTYIVVLPHETDGSQVEAYVVDADCVGKEPSGPGTVLTTRTYPR